MANAKLTLACADYPRVMPLATGSVGVEGADLHMVLGQDGSWPARAAILGRVMNDAALDGGEGSLAQHYRRIDKGDRRFVGLPVFVLRGFAARDLYVRKDGPVGSLADLPGKRVGMYSWVASGSVWYRHCQRHLGVPVEAVRWVIGDIEGDAITPPVSPADLPAPGAPFDVQAAPAGRRIAEMLVAGEIDAMWSPPLPTQYHQANGPIVRLLPDMRRVEGDFYRTFKFFPPVHLVVLRRDVWERDRSLARRVTDAFTRADVRFAAMQRGFPYALPWEEAERDETEALMGRDWHATGVEPNHAALSVFAETMHSLGVISRAVTPEDAFAEFLEG
jgi:4,5-dihydroxyphthalate decarboxylase